MKKLVLQWLALEQATNPVVAVRCDFFIQINFHLPLVLALSAVTHRLLRRQTYQLLVLNALHSR
jgi:hypothetical protein